MMKKEENGTKLCKHCKTEIPADAKLCPHCRKKQGMSGCLIVVIAVIVVAILGIAMGSGSNSGSASSGSQGNTVEEEAVVMEYTPYTVDEMMSDLNKNAMAASEKYKKQYVEISGRLSNIDSNGQYIDVLPANDDWAFIGVSCYLKSDDQKEIVKTLSIGDNIVVRGKITDVGEVLGYYLDIDSIN